VFIDKPLAASLADGIAIAELARNHDVKWFTASALRFSAAIADMPADPKLGDVVSCQAWSPCHLDPTHPDLYWYGIHGVETLFTVMGPGCKSVTRTTTPDTDHVTAVWTDGRIGTFLGIRKGKLDFGATAFGTKGVVTAPGAFTGYEPLLAEVGKFFRTGKAPVTPLQTLEILAFMEAAEESKRQGGKAVTLESVMEKAKAGAAHK
jgi:predicted dehydrogenase